MGNASIERNRNTVLLHHDVSKNQSGRIKLLNLPRSGLLEPRNQPDARKRAGFYLKTLARAGYRNVRPYKE